MLKALCIVLCLSAASFGEWTPPEHAKPTEVLQEARADAAAGRYEDALAKHLWFHRNALKAGWALAGVRLSYALEDWANLGAKYPPALEKLKAVRDESEAHVRSDKEAWQWFADFAAINKQLKTEGLTKELFVWIDANKKEEAQSIYPLAEAELVRAKDYQLCARYVTPKDFPPMVELYRKQLELVKSGRFGDSFRDFTHKKFVNTSTTLVALLSLSDRQADAQRIAAEALQELNEPAFAAELEKAKAGTVPDPWP